MNPSIETLLTPRLRAERIAMTHLEHLRGLQQDPQVMRTLSVDGQIMSDQAVQESLEAAVEHWNQHGFGFWSFFDRSDGRFVGRGGIKIYQIDDQDQLGLAYAVKSELWQRGYATEMARASMFTTFERLGFPELGSWTLIINRGSQRVMEKLGFQYERDFSFVGLPHRFYRMTSADWQRMIEEPSVSSQP